MTNTTVQTGYAAINGGNIYYEMMGEGHPLLLIHGINLDLRMWDDQFAEFADHYRVIRFDMRGFGRSEMTDAPFSNFSDIAALLDHLGIERTYVCGLSFGGYTALEFTLAHPERVDGLILVASGLLGFPMSDDRKADSALFHEVAKQGDLEAALDLYTQQWLAGPGQPIERVPADIRERFRTMAREAFLKPAHNNRPQFLEPSPIGRLSEVHVPTLILTGQLDYIDMTQIADYMLLNIPNVKRFDLPGVAHIIPMEAPERFNQAVLQFLSNLE
jgi:3-oxoadipate enol-lactonase